MVPVDFRNYLTQNIGEALGMYASAVKLQFRYDPINLSGRPSGPWTKRSRSA
jgi:hypothetical protein